MQSNELILDTYKDVINIAVQNKQETSFYAILPKNIVYKGKGGINEEYCKEHDIDIYNSIDFGGGIVGFKGDIVFIVIKQDGFEIDKQLAEIVNDFLIKQGLNTKYDNNDILVDDIYKVASYSSTNIGDNVIYNAIQITFNADPEIIKEICKKDSVKIPRGLNFYNINENELLQTILNYVASL